jgi:hypothetical protein
MPFFVVHRYVDTHCVLGSIKCMNACVSTLPGRLSKYALLKTPRTRSRHTPQVADLISSAGDNDESYPFGRG